VSEISWSNAPINPKEYFKLGDEYEAYVVTIDRAERKMSLSLKQLTQDPWSDIEVRFPVGSRHTGTVRNTSAFGVFVELAEGITGFVHVSDLSWVKRIHHPNEFTKPGNPLEVVVLEIDKENRKLSLGHKQIEEDPWDTFESAFPLGSVHQGTVIKKDDKGALIQLPYGIEAFAPNKHLKKENGKLAELDETLDFKVIEFDRGQKKILVSHTKLIDDKAQEEKKEKAAKLEKERTDTRTELKNINRKIEKSTLGDLGILSDLKDKLEKGDEDSATPKAEEKSQD
jgi:small subunit ribosomal protein S1